eukprot:4646325-Pleurochrysis_carterae.AAC.2
MRKGERAFRVDGNAQANLRECAYAGTHGRVGVGVFVGKGVCVRAPVHVVEQDHRGEVAVVVFGGDVLEQRCTYRDSTRECARLEPLKMLGLQISRAVGPAVLAKSRSELRSSCEAGTPANGQMSGKSSLKSAASSFRRSGYAAHAARCDVSLREPHTQTRSTHQRRQWEAESGCLRP